MAYHPYQAYEQMLAPFRSLAEEVAHHLAQPWPGMADSSWPPSRPAAQAIAAQAKLTHTRPEFGIDRIAIGNREVPVREEIASQTPFCNLVHFAKDIAAAQPRVTGATPATFRCRAAGSTSRISSTI